MFNHVALAKELAELKSNPEQYNAVYEKGHCVVLAGPGSGKTKTLTLAMVRSLISDVPEPRGVACITYNNECSIELETRLAKFGIVSRDRSFVGTIHSFALSQIIEPYGRCIQGLLPANFQIATRNECRQAIEVAYGSVFNDAGDPHKHWRLAENKRRLDVDRSLSNWRNQNPELANFVEAYEAELRRKGLIDFDDMPLIAFRIIKEHLWVREALHARFPVLFIDEYQDLGHALHELVLLLCFDSGIRLFAVGDIDQSIYGFTGANPQLLQSLTQRHDVKSLRLRLNYRSGAKIIRASLGALGEERDYFSVSDHLDGKLSFFPVDGNHDRQAICIAKDVLNYLIESGYQLDQIAILYRAAWLGDKVAVALAHKERPYVRTDSNALIKRSSRLARFIETCANWVTGGWRDANPPYSRLVTQATALVYGGSASRSEKDTLSLQLMDFLHSGIGMDEFTHSWLHRFKNELIEPWKVISRNTHLEWEVFENLLQGTDPKSDLDMPLNIFAGRIEGSGRVTLSTFHSAKGREFDAVILYGINEGDIPSRQDQLSEHSWREARRLFYVGVTRPRKELCLVYQQDHHSSWVKELYDRSNSG